MRMMNKPEPKKSLDKIILWFCLLILCASWLITFLVIQGDRRIEISQAFKETGNLAAVLEKHISGTFSQIESSLFSLRQSWESGITPEAMHMLFNHFVSSRSDLFNLLSIIDAQGNVVITDQKSLTPTYSGDRPFFIYHRDCNDRAMRIGSPILGRVTKKWYIPISMRLNDAQGQFSGVLLASVNPYYFSMIFYETKLGKDSLVYLADYQGIIYSGMLGGEKLNLDKGILPVESSKIISRNDFSPEKISPDGIKRIQSLAFIPGHDMFVAVAVSQEECLESSQSRLLFLLVVQILLSVFILLFILYLRRAIDSRNLFSKELEKSEKKFKKIVENLPLAIAIGDEQGNISYHNPAFVDLFGFELKEIPTVTAWFEKVYPDPLYRAETLVQWKRDVECVKQNPDRIFPSRSYRIVSKNGNVLDMEITFTMIDSQIYTVFHDITEQKKAEKELKEKERRAALQRAGISRLVTDQTFMSGELNDVFKRITEVVSETIGVARVSIWTYSDDHSQIVCKALYESEKKSHSSGQVIQPETMPSYLKAMMTENRIYAEDALNDPRTCELAESYSKPLGISSMLDAGIMIEGILWGVVSCEHIGPRRKWHPDEESFASTIAAIVAQLFENIERKRAQEAQLQAEQKYRLLVENQKDLVVKVDQGGNFLYVSPSYCEVFGKTESELLGKSFMPLVHEDDVESTRKEMEKLYKPPYSCILEQRAMTKEGWRWFMWSDTAELDENMNVFSVIGVGRDITDRKQAEEEQERLRAQLTQAQKMESVGRLAGGVAHDFNNMLGVILGQTELALTQIDNTHPLFENLEEIKKAADHSSNMTRQLLAFARKQTVVPKVIDLNSIVEGMLKMLKRLIGEDITLNWVPGKTPGFVKIDPSQIDQILANLLVNARDAIYGVGKITIETGSAFFNEEDCKIRNGAAPGEYVLLSVMDNGCGMSPETISHLFEPFFTTKELGKGTGLGLATIYGIVRQNNGFIDVSSELGKGTSFRIYLPTQKRQDLLSPLNEDLKTALCGHETILLVEDEPLILKMTAEMLKRQGYTVLSASTPEEAMSLAREHAGKIHLLITDVIMPLMNGRDLARSILSLYPYLKSLFMSGYTANVISDQGILEEKMNFIQKPFTLKDLSAKVREALDKP